MNREHDYVPHYVVALMLCALAHVLNETLHP